MANILKEGLQASLVRQIRETNSVVATGAAGRLNPEQIVEALSLIEAGKPAKTMGKEREYPSSTHFFGHR